MTSSPSGAVSGSIPTLHQKEGCMHSLTRWATEHRLIEAPSALNIGQERLQLRLGTTRPFKKSPPAEVAPEGKF